MTSQSAPRSQRGRRGVHESAAAVASRGFRLLKLRFEISGSTDRKRKSVLGVNTPEHHVMPRGVRSPAALRRICASASSLGGGRTVHHNRFAETTRCRRHPIGGLRPRTPMCTNSVGESLRGSTFGAIPRTTRLPCRCSPDRGYIHRRVRSSLGSAVSLSPRICRRTTPRLFGCHSLIPQPSSWFRQSTPFHVPVPLSH